ncbi:MAG: EamA family transporter [Bryobacterales bacterium]|nr:EamA family transporter [Bryobacterales bacterium]
MGSPHPVRAYIALASVSFFWGTTYLGIRVALESYPPLLLVCFRFCLSGAIMLALCLALRQKMPSWRGALWSLAHGMLILGVGNMALTSAELYVPSSFAALIIAMSPFWLVGLESLMPAGEPLRKPTLAGMGTGLAGVALLMVPGLVEHGLAGGEWKGFLILQVGMFSWTFGSVIQKRHDTGAPPLVNAAIQQMGAGLMYVAPALLWPQKPVVWDTKGLVAMSYLVVFGSIVGYSSYIYALKHMPVSLVSVYPYLNVVVAAVLGWAAYREPFGVKQAASMLMIFLGVAVVKRFSHEPAVRETESATG